MYLSPLLCDRGSPCGASTPENHGHQKAGDRRKGRRGRLRAGCGDNGSSDHDDHQPCRGKRGETPGDAENSGEDEAERA
jgi:hypothetical protein